MRILIADDSVLILERLQQMLSNHDQVKIVGCCSNGTDALKALRTLEVDLAILDIRMPGLSGLEVLNIFRKENKRVKMIILTFNATPYYQQLALQSGADYYFNKIDFEELSLLIAELLSKHGMDNAPTIPVAFQTQNKLEPIKYQKL